MKMMIEMMMQMVCWKAVKKKTILTMITKTMLPMKRKQITKQIKN